MTLEELKIFLGNLTVIEACKLALDLEDAWGVQRPGNVRTFSGMRPAYGAPMPPSHYDGTAWYLNIKTRRYTLTGVGKNHIYTMKILREHLGWDLAKIKQSMAAPEVVLIETDSPDDVAALLRDLKMAGATVSETIL